MSSLAPLLEAFFIDRLMEQRGASGHTVAAYRDTFRLLLAFVQKETGIPPADLALVQLDAAQIGRFLTHLEKDRGNAPRTRNARLAAIHSFFRFVAIREPANLALIQRVLAIPHKRFDRALVTHLSAQEVDALVDAPAHGSWLGDRDHALLTIAVQTGLRVSELIGLTVADVILGDGAHVRCLGKGRKARCTPLRPQTVAVLRSWLKRLAAPSTAPLFPSRRGGALSRDAVERLVAKHATAAARSCRSLVGKTVSPHVLRHTTAMQLLTAGVDCSVIALWLGHESVETTQIYLHADLSIKERALARTAPANIGTRRYRPPDALLAFLEAL